MCGVHRCVNDVPGFDSLCFEFGKRYICSYLHRSLSQSRCKSRVYLPYKYMVHKRKDFRTDIPVDGGVLRKFENATSSLLLPRGWWASGSPKRYVWHAEERTWWALGGRYFEVLQFKLYSSYTAVTLVTPIFLDEERRMYEMKWWYATSPINSCNYFRGQGNFGVEVLNMSLL